MRALVAIALLMMSGLVCAASEQPAAESTVMRLYQDYAWEAVAAEPGKFGTGILQAPVATLGQYFAPALATLIAEDQACVERTQEICKLSFSPIWGTQDPGAVGLTIEPGSEPSVVRVRFTKPGSEETIELSYTLEATTAGWRISNITAADWNLLEILRSEP